MALIEVGLHLIECNSGHREDKVKFSRSREKMGKFIPQMTPVWESNLGQNLWKVKAPTTAPLSKKILL